MRSVEYCTGLFVWGLEVCVGTGGLCSPDCGRVVCSGGSWWRFKVLGVVCMCVIKSLCRLWVFSVVIRLDSGNGCVVWCD